MMDKSKIARLIAVGSLVAILLTVAVLALTNWSHTVNWVIPKTADIKVYTPEGGELATAGFENITSNSFFGTYVIVNVGNSRIHVTATETWTNKGSGTATWTGLPADIDIGKNVTVTLTLNNLPSGTGIFTYSFNPSPL